MVTLDTNIAIYAMTENPKLKIAETVLQECAFLSVQVLNEYANATTRKRQRTYAQAYDDLVALADATPFIAPISLSDHQDAFRIAERHQISFYDALMIAVALANGASMLYSEDMHHGLMVDSKLKIVDPFISAEDL